MIALLYNTVCHSTLSPTQQRALFLRRHTLWPAVLFLSCALLFEGSSLDVWISNLLFEKGRGFVGADAWWANQLLHTGGVRFVALVGVGALAVLVVGLVSDRLQGYRRAALFVVLSMLLGTGIVSLLKETTNVDCPRQLEIFDGDRPYVRVFERKPASLPRGVCWPGGHSSGAFSLLSLYLVLRSFKPRYAVPVLLLVLGLGFAFSVAQWARGAHFVSHDLWSAGICWFVSITLYLLPFGSRLRTMNQND